MDVTRMTGIGRDLGTRLRTFFDPPLGRDASPLEIVQAVLDHVETRIEPAGRGRRVFPYAALHVRVLAGEAVAPALEACFDGLAGRVRERLAEVRCDLASEPVVHLACLPEAPATWTATQVFDVTYARSDASRVESAVATAPVAPPLLSVTVLRGTAAEAAYTFRDATVSIGRMADPSDGLGRMRRNRIAFTDVRDGVTETVGRAHARLRFDRECGAYRLYDEGSSNGTAILREGDVIPVAPRDPRGVRVRSGDEIQVGRALLRVEIGSAPES